MNIIIKIVIKMNMDMDMNQIIIIKHKIINMEMYIYEL